MNIRTIMYHIGEGCRSIFRNGLMSVASIASVSACAFMLIISLTIALNLDEALEKLEENVGISIYLGEDLNDDEVKFLFDKIQWISNVERVEYMTKSDALDWARNEWGDDKGILKGLEDDNPFPRSFELKINGIENQKKVVETLIILQNDFELVFLENKLQREAITNNTIENPLLEDGSNLSSLGNDGSVIDDIIEPSFGDENYEYQGIRTIRHTQNESEILITINSSIRATSFIIIAILSMISVGIIANTIKVTVYVRRNEINIMKYVGATDWFIRWPFVVEGTIIGIVGAVIPTVLFVIGYGHLVSMIYDNLPIIVNYIAFKDTAELFIMISPITISFGGILGILSSADAIKKHLKV